MGNGRAIALGLARAGADIVIADVHLPIAEETCQEVQALGRRALAVGTDVSQKVEVDAMIRKTLDTFGQLHILVNNAGVTSRHDILELSEEEWDRVLNINLKGVFLCTQAAARAMIQLGIRGKIINITSVAATRGVPYSAHYSASKAGVELFSQAAAKALAPRGVYVNCIAPGVMETPLMKPHLDDPSQRKRYQDAVPLGRIGQPEDLAGAVIFLAGPDSDFITGITIRVDGGAAA
jgi:glucose 1-dehydrogenase